jgi:hypothetical protein
MSSAEADTIEKEGQDTGHLTHQFLIVIQKNHIKMSRKWMVR